MIGWTELSGFNLGLISERVSTTIQLPIDITGVTTFTSAVISGNLPPGLVLLNDSIIGTPLEVIEDTEFTFVVRATLNGVISDRTLKITVSGSDVPAWVTSPGLLPVGANNSLYVIESAPVNYSLTSVDSDLQKLTFSIDSGTLPAGLQLTSAGVLLGTVAPIPNLVPTEFQFTVAVTDGIYSVTRSFTILVVNQEFLSSDSSVNLINAFPFTTDVSASSILTWKTPQFLGISQRGEFVSHIIETNATPVTFQISEINHDYTAETITQLPLTENRYGTTVVRLDGTKLPAIGNAIQADQIVYQIVNAEIDGNTVLVEINSPLQTTLISGTKVKVGPYSELPVGTQFNEITGELSGIINYAAARSKTYRFTIIATWNNGNDTILSERCFSLTVTGLNYGQLIWDTESDLGIISPDEPCSKIIAAHLSNLTVETQFSIVSGSLPAALTLSSNGNIVGSVNKNSLSDNSAGMTVFEDDFSLDSNSTKIDRQYSFTVQASTPSGEVLGQKLFYFRINDLAIDACNVTVQPFLKPAQRDMIRDFINDRNIFDQDAIFKPTDPNFGVRSSLSMLVFAGLPVQDLNTLAEAVASTHRLKRLSFGNLGSAVAINSSGAVEYEVVFVEMIDPYEVGSIHLPGTVTFPFTTVPATKTVSSTFWWKEHLHALGEPDSSYVPLWQKSIQPNGIPVGLKNIVPLCYCKPGYAASIIKNINNSEFKFNNIDYTVDRYIVTRVVGHDYLTYIAFDNRNSTI